MDSERDGHENSKQHIRCLIKLKKVFKIRNNKTAAHFLYLQRRFPLPSLIGTPAKAGQDLTFRSSWYFVTLCTGLMSRSVSCSLWPRRCFKSCGFKEEKKDPVLSSKGQPSNPCNCQRCSRHRNTSSERSHTARKRTLLLRTPVLHADLPGLFPNTVFYTYLNTFQWLPFSHKYCRFRLKI